MLKSQAYVTGAKCTLFSPCSHLQYLRHVAKGRTDVRHRLQNREYKIPSSYTSVRWNSQPRISEIVNLFEVWVYLHFSKMYNGNHPVNLSRQYTIWTKFCIFITCLSPSRLIVFSALQGNCWSGGPIGSGLQQNGFSWSTLPSVKIIELSISLTPSVLVSAGTNIVLY